MTMAVGRCLGSELMAKPKTPAPRKFQKAEAVRKKNGQRCSASAIDSVEGQLHCAQDERYEYGRVWEGYGREWVWESGVNVASPPFAVIRSSNAWSEMLTVRPSA